MPLPIPAPVAEGVPGEGYPYPWSIYRWLEGRTADEAFRETLGVDQATRSRGRGWALWKALINLVGALEDTPAAAPGPRRDIQRLLDDFASTP